MTRTPSFDIAFERNLRSDIEYDDSRESPVTIEGAVEVTPDEDDVGASDGAPTDVQFDLALERLRAKSRSAPSDVDFDAALLPHLSRAEAKRKAYPDLSSVKDLHAEAEPLPQPEQKLRDWTLDFGPVWGPAGRQTVIKISAESLFRGEKIIATDIGPNPVGQNTRILQVAIGNKIQRPNSGRGSLTAFFPQNALGNGIKFDVTKPWESISVTVSFITSATFDMSVLGKSVVED